ncbi:MAG: 4'-phosphopantetheinyl transferase superfamily protein, partial [Nevskia sp.]|nr:4'-phosphopantetheinyl transferase superfamily protein [Nevskia sp.]
QAEGLSSSDANERGWSLAELLQAGYNLQQIGALLSGLREDDGSGTGMTIAEAYDAGFSPAEAQLYLHSLPPPQRQHAAVALWCAKEAAAKAAGAGPETRPRDWNVITVEGGGAGQMLVRLRHGGAEYRVELHSAESEVFALCRIEPGAGATALQARA